MCMIEVYIDSVCVYIYIYMYIYFHTHIFSDQTLLTFPRATSFPSVITKRQGNSDPDGQWQLPDKSHMFHVCNDYPHLPQQNHPVLWANIQYMEHTGMISYLFALKK